MLAVHDGQCGLCAHFGEGHVKSAVLIEIRTTHEAAESMIDACGHPKLADLHLRVTPVSGCDGYLPAAA